MRTTLSNCPHCNKGIDKKTIADNRKYRNEARIDVFGCPHCDGRFKLDPAEYIEAKKKGGKIKLYKEIELLESEKKAGFKNVDETIPEYDWDKWLN